MFSGRVDKTLVSLVTESSQVDVVKVLYIELVALL